jgi:hypothetical protein
LSGTHGGPCQGLLSLTLFRCPECLKYCRFSCAGSYSKGTPQHTTTTQLYSQKKLRTELEVALIWNGLSLVVEKFSGFSFPLFWSNRYCILIYLPGITCAWVFIRSSCPIVKAMCSQCPSGIISWSISHPQSLGCLCRDALWSCLNYQVCAVLVSSGTLFQPSMNLTWK